MESNVRERQGSEQCQDKGDEAMGEPGNLPCAQKSELPGFTGARANPRSTRHLVAWVIDGLLLPLFLV